MGLEFWANVSTVWLALLCFIGGLIPLAIAFYAVKYLHIGLEKSRSAMWTAQKYSGVMRSKAEEWSEKASEPVIAAETKAVEINETIRNIAGDGAKRS